eukprot:m.120558 g.120558  ORF g.120558 m.120558 type:complete len:178 (+) comp28811_c0_seq1:207-740(+)
MALRMAIQMLGTTIRSGNFKRNILPQATSSLLRTHRDLTTSARCSAEFSAGSSNILGGGPAVNRVTAFSKKGFVVNDLRIPGSVALLPNLRLQWTVRSVDQITVESLELFLISTPALEILVLGTGDRIEFVPPHIRDCLRRHGIALEVQDTRRAAATYNFLSAEGRLAAAALITPSK